MPEWSHKAAESLDARKLAAPRGSGPDILRFGIAGFYVRYVDVWDAVDALVQVMASGEWARPEFMARKAVT
jgi:kynureninase